LDNAICSSVAFWAKAFANPSSGIQIKPARVWNKLRRLWMSFVFVKDLGDGLSFVQSQRGNIHQSLHALVVRGSNDRTSERHAQQESPGLEFAQSFVSKRLRHRSKM
jgi:hypothetical protein